MDVLLPVEGLAGPGCCPRVRATGIRRPWGPASRPPASSSPGWSCHELRARGRHHGGLALGELARPGRAEVDLAQQPVTQIQLPGDEVVEGRRVAVLEVGHEDLRATVHRVDDHLASGCNAAESAASNHDRGSGSPSGLSRTGWFNGPGRSATDSMLSPTNRPTAAATGHQRREGIRPSGNHRTPKVSSGLNPHSQIHDDTQPATSAPGSDAGWPTRPFWA